MTLQEPEFQELVWLAAQICGTAMSMITVLDENTQWITASLGTTLRETPRDQAFCAYAVQHSEVMVVEDARLDERFMHNPLVACDRPICFYAGISLHQEEGENFGTLCVVDHEPRQISERQRMSLEVLARQVQVRLTLRTKQTSLELALEENRRLSETLKESNALFLAFMNHAPMVSYIKDAAGRMVFYNRSLATRFGVTSEEWLGKLDAEIWSEAIAA